MINNFNNFENMSTYSSVSPVKKVWYLPIDTTIFKNWIDDNPHNNGYAAWWTVMSPNDDSAYPEIDNYLLSQGLEVGDEVLLHDEW